MGNTAFFKRGWARYTIGEDSIFVGLGNTTHRMWNMRNSEINDSLFRLLITDMKPVDRTLKIRCGQWLETEKS